MFLQKAKAQIMAVGSITILLLLSGIFALI
jgi:hypothetical protein